MTEGEVASVIALLSSERAGGVNGEALAVTGGGLW
ncbi:MAG: hypothetical protein M0Z42_19975 [Actinomycetota bacterium]|nr:hypothetical protein [Actinomycetota bacterium]